MEEKKKDQLERDIKVEGAESKVAKESHNSEKQKTAAADSNEQKNNTPKDHKDKNEHDNNNKETAQAKEEKKDPLAEAQKEIEELKDRYLRTAAEFDNYKKRTLREKADLILNGGVKTVTAILPVLDDFERAIADKSEDPKVIKEGVQMIFNKFVKTLESLGVKKIDTKDQDFNTDYHEAVAMVPGMGDDKKGKVIDCVQTGYTMNDKVIRHAKVAVGQ
ncbi:nucleotide exchange factor GrpE [Hallella mizrahii]|jgi:molecular chaperone GrpE|uniref:Protein GrpE n=1 Tax=Hallella mizrahii TaxID=2606637 RepID=A0A7K0KHW3_9BACT|nr:nucleotide exchange factor GrpE [Hallella mizrahii]MST85422.1 nucleotide exchange factor GrpE [Hallella mizrahii]